jgi:hypothetical protein
MSSVRCSERVVKAVADLVKIGVPPLVAAAAQGVDETQFALWMRLGEQNGRGQWRYAQFRERVLKAEADCEVLLVGRVRSAANDGVWQAAMWLAERRFGDRWMRRSVNESAPAPAGPVDPFSELDGESNVTPLRRPGP